MAKKYLDDTGMSYFWGKLKAYFQEKLVSGTNIKTINNETLLGSGDISLIDVFYPVGSYYETSDTVFDPNTSWGGTWVLETEGQVHVSAGSTYTAGATGGAASVTPSFTGAEATLAHSGGAVSDTTLNTTQIPSHTHTYDKSDANTGSTTLTANQIPSHTHPFKSTYYTATQTTLYGINVTNVSSGSNALSAYNSYPGNNNKVTIQNTGGGQGHTHTQPKTSTNSGGTGGGQAHGHGFTQPTSHTYTPTGTVSAVDTRQPYIVVNRWHRTA